MTSTDLVTLAKRLEGLAAYFERPLNETQAEIYLAGLEDLPLEAVIAALSQWVKTGKPFMPKVTEIRELITGTEDTRAEYAWRQLQEAMRRAGSYASVVMADPALAMTVETLWGSWPQACADDLSPEMWASRRKEFGRVYRLACQRGLAGACHLVGLHEAANAEAGHTFTFTPVWIVDAEGVRALPSAHAVALLEERHPIALPAAPTPHEELV